MQILIRPVIESDAAEIISLLNPIILSGRYSSMTEVMTFDDQVRFIETLPSNSIYLSAIDVTTQRLVGVQDVLPKANTGQGSLVGEISTYVSLHSARLGVGRMLSAATFAAARSIGFETMQAIIRSDNNAAIQFYQRIGFDVVNWEFDTICVSDKTIPRVSAEK